MTTKQPFPASSQGWVPEACTLPTAEQPLRVAEFDALFSAALRDSNRPAPTMLRLLLDRPAEAAARDLAARETACCSFFTFAFDERDGQLVMTVTVPAAHIDVLDGLARRATAGGARA
jgi:hypothetical protein